MKQPVPETNRRLLEDQILTQLLEVKRIQTRLEGRLPSLGVAPSGVRASFLPSFVIMEERVASLERLVEAWDQVCGPSVSMPEIV